jgi:hypothetical protein
MPVFGAVGAAVVMVWGGWEDRRERNVKNTVVTKKATAMMILGGRMVWRRYRKCRSRHLISSAAAKRNDGSHPTLEVGVISGKRMRTRADGAVELFEEQVRRLR